MAQIGQIVDGKYRIEKLIGRGGMSRVYLAGDTRLGKTWVVKEIRKSCRGQENSFPVEAALSEADIIKSLDHPAVVRIVDIVQDKHAVYIVEDYVEGMSLKDYTDRGGTVDERRLKNWAVQLCRVLIYLHSRRPPVIFRDLKPENVILMPSGHLKLVDFGIARRYQPDKTRDTVYLGTEYFAAPEQFEEKGLQTDMRTDIYGLGKTLEYLSEYADGLSDGFMAVIRKCLKPEPDDRYPDAGSLLEDLEHYEDRQKHLRMRRLRKRILVMAAAACLIAGGRAVLMNKEAKAAMEDVRALIDTIQSQGSFTEEEEEKLLNLLLPELDSWKEEEGFEKTAFEIGTLYWNYYAYGTDHTAGKVAAVPWFSLARGYDPAARVYELTGKLWEDIFQTAPESWEKGSGAAFFERLRTLLACAEKDGVSEEARLEACLLAADILASGAFRFLADGVESSQVEDLIRRAEQLANGMEESSQTEPHRLRIARSLILAQKVVENDSED